MSLARRDVISIKTPNVYSNPTPDRRRAICGGDVITQRTLTGRESMIVVAGVFLVRFGLGPLSLRETWSRNRTGAISAIQSMPDLAFVLFYRMFPDGGTTERSHEMKCSSEKGIEKSCLTSLMW